MPIRRWRAKLLSVHYIYFSPLPPKKEIDYKKNNGLNILLFARDTFVLAQKYHQTASFSVKKQIKFKI